MRRHQHLKFHPPVMDCRSRLSHYRRSRGNGNPVLALWIPAFAGMRDQEIFVELEYDVHDAQVSRAHGCAGAAE
jgi:hypothetical protein